MSNSKQMADQPLSSAVSVEEESNPHKRLREDSSLVLQKDNFKTTLARILVPEIAGLSSKIQELSTRNRAILQKKLFKNFRNSQRKK